MNKTPAIRILEQQGIPYDILEYTYDPQDLDVGKIARDNHLDIQRVYKTLILKGNKSGIFAAVIPGHLRLNRKAMARATGNKKVSLLAIEKLPELTGYIRGACSPLGLKSSPPVYFDITAEALGKIWVNAGQRGLLMELYINDLIRLTGGKMMDIAVP